MTSATRRRRVVETSPINSLRESLCQPLQHLLRLLLQPPDDHDGQDDALVFVSLELAAQPLCGFPDVAGQVIELGFVEGKGHEKRAPYCSSVSKRAFLPSAQAAFCQGQCAEPSLRVRLTTCMTSAGQKRIGGHEVH